MTEPEIGNTANDEGKLAVTGNTLINGILNVGLDDNGAGYAGIFTTNALTINSDKTDAFTVGTKGEATINNGLNLEKGSATIKGTATVEKGGVTLASGTTLNSAGPDKSKNDTTATNSTITVNNGDVTVNSGAIFNIDGTVAVNNGSLKLSKSNADTSYGQVNLTGDNGEAGGNLTVSNIVFYNDATTDGNYQKGSAGALNINGGKLTVTGTKAAIYTVDKTADGTVDASANVNAGLIRRSVLI